MNSDVGPLVMLKSNTEEVRVGLEYLTSFSDRIIELLHSDTQQMADETANVMPPRDVGSILHGEGEDWISECQRHQRWSKKLLQFDCAQDSHVSTTSPEHVESDFREAFKIFEDNLTTPSHAVLPG